MKDSTRMRDCFKMGKCRRYALSIIVLSLFVSVFSAIGTAQASQPVQASNPAAGAKTTQSRNATLQELYGMLFTYAAHVETKAVADEKLGNDRSFYRQHLQIASGLTTDEYAQVLASALRFAAVDADVKAQIAETIEAGASTGQIDSLFEQRDSSLKAEIANVRQLLGQDQADIFEAYLQNEYIQQGSSPTPSQTQVSSPKSPSSSSSYTAPPSSSQASLQVSAQAAALIEATPETVAAIGSEECKTGYTMFYNGSYTICADSQLSYVGSGQVEPYAAMYATWTNLGALGYLEIQGYFYVNGVFNTNLGCYGYYPSATSCQHSPNVSLNSGNGALYQWYGKTSIGAYDVQCVVPSSCYETEDSEWSDPAEVQIYYPDINYISPSTVTPGDTGKTLTIDGEGLISPFQNTPTVSVTGSAFSSFYVQSFNYAAGTITVGYSVLSSANAGTQTVTVNNGFGTGAVNITVNAPAPVITGITVSGSSAFNALQAGPATQTVTLTGSHLDTTWPTISIVSGGAGVTLGSVVSASQTSVSFHVTVASDASAGTVTFQLDTDGKSCNAPALKIVAMVPPVASINFNGTNITDTADSSPTQVVVGQQIYLSISLANGDDPSTIATSIDWTVPGIVIRDFSVSSDHTSAQVVPLTQTEQPTIVFFWVSTGGNATASYTVQYTYCVDVNMESCATATASFVVSGPTNAAMTATPGPAELFNYSENGDPSEPTMLFGDETNPGMTFTAQMTFSDAIPQEDQSAMFVQLMNFDNFKNIGQSGVITSCTGPANAPALDSRYPMPNVTSMSADDVPLAGMVDDNGLGYAESKRYFSATTYLMFPPPSTPCNSSLGVSCYVPVPLGYTTWNYGGDAINTLQVQNVPNKGATTINNTSYVLNSCSGCTSSSPEFVPSSPTAPTYGYPTWTAKSVICDPVASNE